MNKRSVKKKRPAKAARSSPVRKSPARAAVRKAAPRPSARKKAEAAKAVELVKTPELVKAPEPAKAIDIAAVKPAKTTTVTVAQVTALSTVARSHRFRVGQTVFYTSSPISRPGASGSYEVVRLLPSDGDDYQYRIKNAGEAFERVAKESQLESELELEH
jgi:hypothetical protein